ncbi:hypothetical protein EYC80_006594 [Monilinia laxa]|uniref:Ribosomal eL28/Mak16 domain-containing protein n=1 Tax=Monilinia laxa TaxID=61186 RepID=A0A5N6JU96_MONLA|nr:hypothetical protein EYC80_006594 [Monilinia laxa]
MRSPIFKSFSNNHNTRYLTTYRYNDNDNDNDTNKNPFNSNHFTMSQYVSADFIWEVTRSQNAFLVKRTTGGGSTFSRDPLNLTNKHSTPERMGANWTIVCWFRQRQGTRRI